MNTEFEIKAAEQALNGIHLPPCPASLMAVMKEVRSPDANMAKIARVVEQDVGLSAPMLKLANSPFFGLRRKVSTIQQAVTVLGLKNTANLLSNVALRANVVPDLPGMNEFWDRSGMASLAASRIAARIPGLSRDDAYTVALFHNCGIPVLMQKYPDYLNNIDDLARISGKVCVAENAFYSTTHAVVGSLLARNWMLPVQMCRAILLHHDITIFDSIADQASFDVCNWVGVIQAAEYMVDCHLNLRNESWAIWQHPVMKHLHFSEMEFAELCSDVVEELGGGDE
jgi:HD-like signal output (HDOD) protein